jgi:hypothetical protein
MQFFILWTLKATSHETDIGQRSADARKAEFTKVRGFRIAHGTVIAVSAAYLAYCEIAFGFSH